MGIPAISSGLRLMVVVFKECSVVWLLAFDESSVRGIFHFPGGGQLLQTPVNSIVVSVSDCVLSDNPNMGGCVIYWCVVEISGYLIHGQTLVTGAKMTDTETPPTKSAKQCQKPAYQPHFIICACHKHCIAWTGFSPPYLSLQRRTACIETTLSAY
eukprot:scaffold20402_cov72-Skeletonema_dohrnii-CCMP3373.AAC.2